ncbi:transcriptional regulator [Sphingomonas sp. SFZ2018-12]|uniref:helix-turn-helix domain-containing protein n=1 Tax=Sphingomonas sp. SFZ2018-12 TaxID=2683197 RepID=UPI001F0D9342|nr:helix-turn-helix domain-containing protein [Sphingomonas sp. SFZ2018-12]MCH4893398.1 transcriptional regulator [Sphingomonas sp. SFZ2018-12]
MISDWHPEDIKAAIRKRGMTLSALARLNGMKPPVLTASMGARVSARSERIIAECIGTPPHEIWPSRYEPNGKRKWMRRPTHLEGAAA